MNLKSLFETKVDEVKVLVENLETKIQIVAEGHDLLNRNIEGVKVELSKKIDKLNKDVIYLKSDVYDLKSDVGVLKTDVSVLKKDVSVLKTDMDIVKDYVIGVDAKLNEHETILKRVK